MPTASWNGAVIADARDDQVHIVENNVYFPMSAVRLDYLLPSDTQTLCPWKGTARYFSLSVDGLINHDAAWTYPEPLEAAKQIAHHVAFWNGVTVQR